MGSRALQRRGCAFEAASQKFLRAPEASRLGGQRPGAPDSQTLLNPGTRSRVSLARIGGAHSLAESGEEGSPPSGAPSGANPWVPGPDPQANPSHLRSGWPLGLINPQVPKQTYGLKDNRLLWARAVQARGPPRRVAPRTARIPGLSDSPQQDGGEEWSGTRDRLEGVTWTDPSSVLLSRRELEARVGAGPWLTSHAGPWEAPGLPGLSLQASRWAGRRAWGTGLLGRAPSGRAPPVSNRLLSEAGEGERPVPREAAPRHPAALWQPPRQAWECDWREQGLFPRESAAGCQPRPV